MTDVPAYAQSKSREISPIVLLGGLAALVVVLSVASLFIGRLGIGGVADLIAVQGQDSETFRILLIEVRLPRTVLALTVGATLGLSGAVLQGLLRNPLAEPFILGASSSAALGAVIVFYFGVAGGAALATPLGGVAGTMVATAALLALGGRAQEPLTLILAGVALNALAAALTSLALNLAPSPYAALEIVFWILGSFADRSLDHLVLALPLMGIGWVLLFSTWRALDALTLGEDAAASLGFNLAAIKIRAILGCAFAVGAAVATTGVISFVGLVVPHVLRPFVGYRPSRLLPASLLGGAALMLAADIGVRLIDTQLELKIGVVTALIGTPFFFHLLYVLRRSGR
ncbi:MAG: iron chelate uptake ABC transporter family permease subunit [Alphaproteobacteria bacterium]|nr:iron chelate uptake ABC transporter family permease subunit [Alphaproteobacteria bacterium]